MENRPKSVKHSDYLPAIRGRLKDIRLDLGLGVRGFARGISKVGYEVSQASISGYENGTTIPAQYVAAVCEAYDINPTYLIWGEPPKQRQQPDEAAKKLAALRGLIDATENDWIEVVRPLLEQDEG